MILKPSADTCAGPKSSVWVNWERIIDKGVFQSLVLGFIYWGYWGTPRATRGLPPLFISHKPPNYGTKVSFDRAIKNSIEFVKSDGLPWWIKSLTFCSVDRMVYPPCNGEGVNHVRSVHDFRCFTKYPNGRTQSRKDSTSGLCWVRSSLPALCRWNNCVWQTKLAERCDAHHRGRRLGGRTRLCRGQHQIDAQ